MKDAMITPPYLHEGDTIGLFAPARPGDEAMISAFTRLVESRGFAVKQGGNLTGSHGQFSAKDGERKDILAGLWSDPQVKALMAVRGGYGAVRLLEDLPYTLFRDQPKWLLGFSDVTALHSALNRHSGLETMHCWMPVSLIMDEKVDQPSLESFFDAISGQELTYSAAPHPLNISGSVSGELSGGNLSVLYSLAGTPWEPEYEGKILFLEDLDEYLYHIDRMCMNFALRGVFNKIAGLVVGGMSDMHDNPLPFGKNAEEIIAGYAAKYNVPVMFGFPSGHKSANRTLIFGRSVTLTTGSSECRLTFSAKP